MIERSEKVKTQDGVMDVFFTRPDGAGPFPVAIQIMDALGMRDELLEHARRVASWGYCVITPDLLYRSGVKGPVNLDEAGIKVIMGAMKELTDARAISDVDQVLKLADKESAARKGKAGIFGYCMGGRLTLVLAQAFGDRIAAGGSVHPGGLAVDAAESPHKHVDKVKAKLYFGIADKDNGATPEQMAELEKALKAKGINYQLEWYPGALHGFMMPHRADAYNKDAAEKCWGRFKDLFASTLK